MLKDIKLYWQIFSRYAKHHKKLLTIGIIIAFLHNLANLTMPIFTKFLIDDVLDEKRMQALFPLLLLMGLMLLVVAVTQVLSNYFFVRSFQKMNFDIKFSFFRHLQALPLNFHNQAQSGELACRLFYDTDVIERSFSEMLVNFFLNLLFVIVIGWIMISWQPLLTFFVFAVLILQTVVLERFQKPLLRLANQRKSELEGAYTNSIEHFNAIELIKAHGSEKSGQLKFHQQLHKLTITTIRSFMLTKFAEATTVLINTFWSFAVLWLGGYQVIKGYMTTGTLMAFLLISGMLYDPIGTLIKTLLGFQDVRSSIGRYLAYANLATEYNPIAKPLPKRFQLESIVFDNVSFGYTEKPILKQVDLKLPAGKIIALVGKSGAGKTSLCRLIARLYEPQSGVIFINNNLALSDYSLSDWRKKIGYVLQNQFLIGGTIAENISLRFRLPMKKIIEAAKLAGAHDFISRLPDGYYTQVGENGVKLSQGEAQRVSLARIFLRRPDIIILDEPTAHVDGAAESHLMNSLIKFKETSTIIIIAHRLSTIKRADMIVVIDDSTISHVGTHDQLLQIRGIYHQIFPELMTQERSV